MPYLETPGELAEALADAADIYSDPTCPAVQSFDSDVCLEHAPRCNCRINWVARVEQRIRDSVKNERALEGSGI